MGGGTVAISPTVLAEPPLVPCRRTALGGTTSTRAGMPLVKASMSSKNVICVNSGVKRSCGA